MRKIAVLVSVLGILLGCAGASIAGTSIYGISGLIETPDDAIVQSASVDLTGNFIADVANTGFDGYTFGGVAGILPKLEVGAVGIGSDAPGVNTEVVVNAKFRILDETYERPSISVGAVDITESLNVFNRGINDPSFFVVVGKNLSSMAEGVTGMVAKPVRGTIGFGTGLYKGGFAGLSIAVAPKFDIMAEYLANGLRQDGTFNAGVKFRPVSGLSISAGTLDFDEWYGGVNYSLSTY
jgi:hypothetical protein